MSIARRTEKSSGRNTSAKSVNAARRPGQAAATLATSLGSKNERRQENVRTIRAVDEFPIDDETFCHVADLMRRTP